MQTPAPLLSGFLEPLRETGFILQKSFSYNALINKQKVCTGSKAEGGETKKTKCKNIGKSSFSDIKDSKERGHLYRPLPWNSVQREEPYNQSNLGLHLSGFWNLETSIISLNC